MSDYFSKNRKINTISIINQDPLLSQFKHHFILMKVYLPRIMNIQTFAERVPQGFGIPYNIQNSVYIAQLVNAYQEDLVDIAIGFRRDQTAINLTKRNPLQFKQENKISEVQLSNGFKIFMQELRNQEIQQQKIRDDYSNITQKLKANNNTKPANKQQIKKPQNIEKQKTQILIEKNKRQGSQSRSKSKSIGSRSRSRSRSRDKKKQLFKRSSSFGSKS